MMFTLRYTHGGAAHLARFSGNARWRSRCSRIGAVDAAAERPPLDLYAMAEVDGSRPTGRHCYLESIEQLPLDVPLCRICLAGYDAEHERLSHARDQRHI